LEIIRSKSLSKHRQLIHGVSTKAGGNPPFFNNLSRHVGDEELIVKQNRDKFFGELGIDQTRLVHANQVHSNNVKIVSRPGLIKETDGLITDKKNLFLIISVADCLPVMIYDRKNNLAANIHAGWRGTQKKIVSRAMEILISECNSKPEDLEIFLGPCISQKNFEVGSEVAESFGDKFVSLKSGKYFVDIAGDNISQLKSFGLKDGQIEVNELCTYDSPDLLHSYRRDKKQSGRMFAVIGIRSNRG